jgi:hypothetical protein
VESLNPGVTGPAHPHSIPEAKQPLAPPHPAAGSQGSFCCGYVVNCGPGSVVGPFDLRFARVRVERLVIVHVLCGKVRLAVSRELSEELR